MNNGEKVSKPDTAAGCWICHFSVEKCTCFSCHLEIYLNKIFFLICFLSISDRLHLTFAPPPQFLTFQPWRNLEAIPPLRHSGSHLTRSITLCLFQLKLTPFAVKSMLIPCRKVTHPCYTRCPGGLSVSGCILCCYKKIYTVKWLKVRACNLWVWIMLYRAKWDVMSQLFIGKCIATFKKIGVNSYLS